MPYLTVTFKAVTEFPGCEFMDPDIEYIIDEEKKLLQLLDDIKISARKRIEEHRKNAASLKDAECDRIESEYTRLTEIELQKIKNEMLNEQENLRREQESFFDNVRLKNKITGRIVSIILENRA